jgi:hypothetical protein
MLLNGGSQIPIEWTLVGTIYIREHLLHCTKHMILIPDVIKALKSHWSKHSPPSPPPQLKSEDPPLQQQMKMRRKLWESYDYGIKFCTVFLSVNFNFQVQEKRSVSFFMGFCH